MSALLNTLPGDIPGLLRRGSPAYGRRGGKLVVLSPTSGAVGHALISDMKRSFLARLAELELDLTDPTGRAHAAWWVGARLDLTVWPIEPGSEDEARMLAQGGEDLTPTQIDTLARLVLRLAGRTP